MAWEGCLSAVAPCEQMRRTGQVCDVCQKAHDHYVTTTRDRAIAEAKRVLEANGYTVTRSD